MDLPDNPIPTTKVIQTGTRSPQNIEQEELNKKMDKEFNKQLQNQEPKIDKEESTSSILKQIEEPDFIRNLMDKKDKPTSNTFTQQTGKNQYNIFDMFWLINDDVYKPDYVQKEEKAEFVILSYNANFGNLRIVLYHLTDTTFDFNIVFQQELYPLINGTIYPSTCFRFMNDLTISEITGMEQLIHKTGEEWQKERPIVSIKRNPPDGSLLEIKNRKTSKIYTYNFKGWQNQIFLYSLKFVYEQGFLKRMI